MYTNIPYTWMSHEVKLGSMGYFTYLSMGYIAVKIIVHVVTFDPNFLGHPSGASEASLMAGPTPSYLEEDAKTQQGREDGVFGGGLLGCPWKLITS